MGKRAEVMKSEILRRRARELLAAGYAPAQAAKALAKESGRTVDHARRIIEQESTP